MKKYLSAILIASVLWSLSGCGSSGGSANGSNGEGPGGGNGHNVVIDDAQSAKNSYAVLGNAVEIMDLTEELRDYHNYVNINRPREFHVRHEGTTPCTTGQVAHKIEIDEDVSPVRYRVHLGFENCVMEDGAKFDGNVTYEGDQSAWQVVFENLVKDEGDEEESVTLNGTMNYEIKDNTGPDFDITYNGTLAQKWSDREYKLTLNHFTIDVDILENQNTSLAANGKVALQSNPTTCADGNYTIETVERVVVDHDSDDPVSGKVKVNGIVYNFNGDGTVTANVNGQSVTFDQDVEDINCSAMPQS